MRGEFILSSQGSTNYGRLTLQDYDLTSIAIRNRVLQLYRIRFCIYKESDGESLTYSLQLLKSQRQRQPPLQQI